jgi:hypothetical protein
MTSSGGAPAPLSASEVLCLTGADGSQALVDNRSGTTKIVIDLKVITHSPTQGFLNGTANAYPFWTR